MKILIKILFLQIFLCSYFDIGKCEVPDNCECNEGNKIDATGECQCECLNQYEMKVGKCKPICEKDCPQNSQCIEPNVCACDEGYEWEVYNNSTNSECLPKCDQECALNAKCIKPNVCECVKGYEKLEEQCKPICKSCPNNSTCIEPDKCICNKGFLENKFKKCEPICSKPCPELSSCIEPEKCVCQKHYEMKGGKCWPICKVNCPPNSKCIRPNSCACDKGYESKEYVNNTNFKCLPKCDQECPLNAKCIRPNICQCVKGYEMFKGQCEPLCKSCPANSICTEPYKCTCNKGFLENESKKCEPICSKPCPEFSKCIKPEICQCQWGYEMKKGNDDSQNKCEPKCSLNCINATCIAPEKCHCNKGYKFQNNSLNICEPDCNTECINGICIEPNKCICLDKFEPKIKNSIKDYADCQLIKPTEKATFNWWLLITSLTLLILAITIYIIKRYCCKNKQIFSKDFPYILHRKAMRTESNN